MTEVHLENFEKPLELRRLTLDDFDALVELQRACFPGMAPWRREHIESQTRIFPDGQLCIEYDGRLVASSSSLIVDSQEYDAWHNYKEISDNGYIRNHTDDGDTLYGIEIMVHPDQRGYRLSRRLYEGRKQLARERNLARIMIGGRIPGYHAHAETLSARDYVEAVIRRSLHDPVLTAQLANGFTLKRLIPNYMPSDKASCGYATFLEWSNVDHQPTPKRHYRAVQDVRVGIVQFGLRPIADFDEFANQCEFFVDVAADHRADFAVFPELFTTQLLSYLEPSRPGQAPRQLADLAPAYLDLFRNLAVRYNLNLIGGSTFLLDDDRLYNAAHLFRRDGTIERQLKLHVTEAERRWWGLQGGSELEVFDTDRGPVAILLSTDVEYPELARLARARGAQVLFVPFNTSDHVSYLRLRLCAQTRAIENDVYVATSGCVGNLPQVDNVDIHYAQSGIYTPASFNFPRDGVANECPLNNEAVVVSDLDLQALTRHRLRSPSLDWSAPRHDLYRLHVAHDGAWDPLPQEAP